MDFDLRHFVGDSYRIKDDLKKYVHGIATRFIEHICKRAILLGEKKVTDRNVLYIVFEICVDPFTRYNRHGYCSSQQNVKPMYKVFGSAMKKAQSSTVNDEKTAKYQARLSRQTRKVFERMGISVQKTACAMIAACISEMCGLMLNGHRTSTSRTMTLDDIKSSCTTHMLSNGELSTNSSMGRFVNFMTAPVASFSDNNEEDTSETSDLK